MSTLTPLTPLTLFLMRLSVAPLFLKREYLRLARWTGLGEWGAMALAAAVTGFMAAAVTLVRSPSQVGAVLVSLALGLLFTAAFLSCLVAYRVPGGAEQYYLEKRRQMAALAKAYRELRSQRRAEQEALRRKMLEEQAQEKAREDAERRAAADLVERPSTHGGTLDVGQRFHGVNATLGNRACWYCGQPVSMGDIQCLCCRAVQV